MGKPKDREILTAHVVATKQVSNNVVRVTVGGDELRKFTPLGFDQWFRLFLQGPEQDHLRAPTTAGNMWVVQYMMMSKGTRPIGRNYTVVEYRPAGSGVFGGDSPELDIDFVTHQGGLASDWAQTTTPGADVALLDEGTTYEPAADAEWQLLVGDESAMPAILGILRSAPRDLRAEVYIELPDADDAQEVDAPVGANIHWLTREAGRTPGALALETVSAAALPQAPCYAFVAGQNKLATGLRRHLVHDRKVPKSHVTFTGYWR